MRIYIDDGSTHIKMLWEQHGRTFTHLSPNSFKRGWSATFGSGKPFNYTAGKEKYSFDLISPDSLTTSNIEWQYSPLNVVAVHHALQTSGLTPQGVDIVVTLPLAEFYDEDAQYRLDNIERKKQNLLQPVVLNNCHVFTITRVTVRPESIPAGIVLCDQLSTTNSVLIVDLGGTTLDISQVAGQMSSVSRIYGDPALGVSLVTDEVQQALRKAGMALSRYNVERLIIKRFDDTYLANNINDPRAVDSIKQAIHSGIARYRARVLEMIDRFKGYTHVTVVGGGACLLADDIRTHVNLREDRFFVAQDPQFALAAKELLFRYMQAVAKRIRSSLLIANTWHARSPGMEVVRFGAGRVALKFGQQKINIHEYGGEIKPMVHLPVPGLLDLCLVIRISVEELLAHLNTHGIAVEEGPVKRTGVCGETESVYLRAPDLNVFELSAYINKPLSP